MAWRRIGDKPLPEPRQRMTGLCYFIWKLIIYQITVNDINKCVIFFLFLDISVSKNHVSLSTAIRLNKTMNQELYMTMLFYSTKLRQKTILKTISLPNKYLHCSVWRFRPLYSRIFLYYNTKQNVTLATTKQKEYIEMLGFLQPHYKEIWSNGSYSFI